MPKSKLYTFQEAKGISIATYLSYIGIEPSRIRHNDQWYYSPFRNERTPSFKVNNKYNVWYDHGIGEGGTLIDLGVKLHNCSRQEFLVMLSNGNYHKPEFKQAKQIPVDNKLKILSVDLIRDPGLIEYLKIRNISPLIAKKYCSEVAFQIGSGKYLAVGFPNKSKAFELRNNWFKGSSSPKDISLLNDQLTNLSVFEGFIDFLSILQLREIGIDFLPKHTSYLILNSLSLLKQSIPLIENHQNIHLFLDNDSAAKKATGILVAKGIAFHDLSYLYAQHKDLNDFLISQKATIIDSTKKSKGFSI